MDGWFGIFLKNIRKASLHHILLRRRTLTLRPAIQDVRAALIVLVRGVGEVLLNSKEMSVGLFLCKCFEVLLVRYIFKKYQVKASLHHILLRRRTLTLRPAIQDVYAALSVVVKRGWERSI